MRVWTSSYVIHSKGPNSSPPGTVFSGLYPKQLFFGYISADRANIA